jgi:hypothetical protein
MTAGVPGLGLSGLFVIMSVLVMLPARIVRGRPHDVHPVRIASIVIMAVAIAATIWLSWQFTVAGRAPEPALTVGGSGAAHAGSQPLLAIMRMPAIVISLAVVFGLIAVVELLAVALPKRKTRTEPPILRRTPTADPVTSTMTPDPIDRSTAVLDVEMATVSALTDLTERVGRIGDLLMEHAEDGRRERRELLDCLAELHKRLLRADATMPLPERRGIAWTKPAVPTEDSAIFW